MLETCFKKNCNEAGIDEAGRGCLAGPVYAAAVIFPDDYKNSSINDSKQLSAQKRDLIRLEIEKNAICYSVFKVDETIIDHINILKSSILAMHNCIDMLSTKPKHLIIDGNYFIPHSDIEYKTIIKGDSKFLNIAAASILAKTYRDEFMKHLDILHPEYKWQKNKGYGTKEHIDAISKFGLSPYHRKSFSLKSIQLSIF